MRGVILYGDAHGYQARLVEACENEWTGETDIRVLRVGPELGNAGLVARTRAIDWATSIGARWIDDEVS